MIAPTGRAVELVSGRDRAVIGTVAAVLRSLELDGVQVTEPIPDGWYPRSGNGIVLSPWPNRVRDGRWTLDGQEQQLALTEPARRNAIHGLLRYADYEIRAQSADAVTLGAIIPPQPGWPAFMDTWVEYRLVPGGLDVHHGASNLSSARTPYGAGAHPYLRIGDAPVEGLVLTVRADEWVESDERLLPIGRRSVDGTRYDLRGGVRVGDVGGLFDTSFAGVRHAEDGTVAQLDDPSTGRRLSLRQDADWRYLHVFTPTAFRSADGSSRQALAIEPMTAPPDALRSGEGLVWLEPGESWAGSWGLRLE